MLGSFSAAAQTTGAGTTGAASRGSAACAELWNDKSNAGFKKAVQCEMDESDRRMAAARARIKANVRETATALQVKACGDFLLKGVADKKWTLPSLQAEAGGEFTDKNTCPIAVKHGFNQRAALPAPVAD